MKRHKIKRERAEPSASYSRGEEEHDLAYYIHDRVELMHQVFSALKPKDLRAMTPSCIRHLSVDNIKELCTEELLGISSKRLCAILDGAEPPTDTESSLSPSPERLETISLDSISSDEEILCQASKKAKKKHRHRTRSERSEKSEKSKRKKKSKQNDDNTGEKSKASRAGLTVLELLELQARARAIRAQLQQEQAAKQSTEVVAESSQDASSSSDEVLVKEEPPEVVEISSSDDEKPSITELEKGSDFEKQATETEKTDGPQNKVTKRINNLVITVPQAKTTRKIKLNRSKSNHAQNIDKAATSAASSETSITVVCLDKDINNEKDKSKDKAGKSNSIPTAASKAAVKDAKMKEKLKKKQKKHKVQKQAVDNGSDHDEIMLQLSDSEKLDLLEDLDRKNFDNVSSQSSVDSESSSSSSDDDGEKKRDSEEIKEENKNDEIKGMTVTEKTSEQNNDKEPTDKIMEIIKENSASLDNTEVIASQEVLAQKEVVGDDNGGGEEAENTIKVAEQTSDQRKSDNVEVPEKVAEVLEIEDKVESSKKTNDNTLELKSQEVDKSDSVPEITQDKQQDKSDTAQNSTDCEVVQEVSNVKEIKNVRKDDLAPETSKESPEETNLQDKNGGDKQLSEGEVSDRDSSEVEATELQPEVVYISDEEGKSKKSKKKHRKKDKKSKKEKKSKKNKSDFRSGSDQNFYKEDVNEPKGSISVDDESEPIVIDEDDIYEILELSDDSSCYEVEGTVLSKEPTTEEIEALSAKIDEIERVEVITEEEIREHERIVAEKTTEEVEDNLEQISWKDRYLGSTKVKKVLTTSNILNAMRKKNKELKKKLEESKTKEADEEKETANVEAPEEPIETNLEEGSIEQYNTLHGSTKYVDPVKEPEVNTEDTQKEKEGEKEKDGVVTKEMKKDAKQLLKMYKRLLKYNDMNKQKDPNKKKKKKQKKNSKDSESVASVVNSGM